MPVSFFITSWGCKLNLNEDELLADVEEDLKNAPVVDIDGKEDVGLVLSARSSNELDGFRNEIDLKMCVEYEV